MPGKHKEKASQGDGPYESYGSEPHYVARDRSERLARHSMAVGCLVALACLTSTAVNVYFYMQKSAVHEGSLLSCFQCDDLHGYPVDWNKVQYQREDSNLCCVQSKDFLNLVQKVSLKTAKQEMASVQAPMPNGKNEAVPRFRASAHLGLPGLHRRGGEACGCNVTTEITTWQTGTTGHVRGDLSVRSGRILVKSTGIYHVYSQVSYDEPSSGSTSIPMHRQSIVRDNPSLHVVAEELLTTQTTWCKDLPSQQSRDDGSSAPTSSYLGAALQLFRGDEVYVKASCIDNLKNAATETYMGMYMV